eukprot:jgi/Astpho2/5821/fgenesh1_pg.00080_%23_70_t
MLDVHHRKCLRCNKKTPNFGMEGERPTHCADCKLDGMRDIRNKKCIVCKQKRPNFGTEGGTATHCSKCQLDGMQNVNAKRENQLANFLKENIDVPWTAWNKQLAGSRECGGSRRPDFVWLLPHLAIVTECDENQHDDRCLPGERQRMFDIFNTYGGIHTIYLRFNPDAFKVDGVTRRVSREKRYAILKKALDLELARTPEDVAKLPLFRVNYLFYDVTDNIYERKVFVPNEAYENAVWSEELIPDM